MREAVDRASGSSNALVDEKRVLEVDVEMDEVGVGDCGVGEDVECGEGIFTACR